MSKSYFVRTCIRNQEGKLQSLHENANGFIWPEEVGSVVTAPDWDPSPTCGHGLHGLRPGDQEPGCWAEGPDAVWLVCSYDPATAVVLEGKIKVPSCVVEYVVDLKDGAPFKISQWLKEQGVFEPLRHGVDIAYLDSDAKSGVNGKSLAHHGSAESGNVGLAYTTDGVAKAGSNGIAITRYNGSCIAGHDGVALVRRGTGEALSGDKGFSYAYVAITGDTGLAFGGLVAQAGPGGTLIIPWFDTLANKDRYAVGYVGENGIKPNTPYTVDQIGDFVELHEATRLRVETNIFTASLLPTIAPQLDTLVTAQTCVWLGTLFLDHLTRSDPPLITEAIRLSLKKHLEIWDPQGFAGYTLTRYLVAQILLYFICTWEKSDAFTLAWENPSGDVQ